MSMWKPFVQTVTAVLMIALLGATVGCKDKKSTFKAPDIKVITTDNVHIVEAVDDSTIWIGDSNGKIFHSADGGASWQLQPNPAAEKGTLLTGSEFIDARTGWITGLHGTILHTQDGGATWQQQNTTTEYHLFSISFTDADNGWAIGEWNTVLRTTNGGRTWFRLTEEEDMVLTFIDMADNLHGWIVGEAGLILYTADGGATWHQQMPKIFERATENEVFENPRPGLFCVQAIDADTAFISGLEALILRTTDAGLTWEPMQTESQYPLYTIKIKHGKGRAVGDKGAYLLSEDNGETWSLQEDVITSKQWFRDISFSSPDKGWVVGQAGMVVVTNDGGATWQFLSGLSYDMDFFEMPKALEFRDMPTWGPFARQ
jgi:photosystem II stability/assembly factor-like uncharacterized protein